MKNRVGESRKMNNGLMATIIEYNSFKDMTIQFENGQVKHRILYCNFKNGEVQCPMLIQPENEYLRVTNPNTGATFIIDVDDVEKLDGKLWSDNGNSYIVTRYNNKKYNNKLHRIIMNAPDDKEVDHINGDKSDNRKCNLRLCDRSGNVFNRDKYKINTSGYKGITWNKSHRKWVSRIGINYDRLFLGDFDNKEDAARAYNEAAIKYHGEYAKLNNVGGTI